MKGILFKDFLSAKRILTIYLLMIICFSFGGAKGVFFALCYSIMVPVNLLGFDERSRFDRYASVLPLTGLQCVADKYIVTYLCMAMMMALSSLIAFIRTAWRRQWGICCSARRWCWRRMRCACRC